MPNLARMKRLLEINVWARARGFHCHPEVSYRGYLKAARRQGFHHRTTNNMIYYLPDEGRIVGHGRYRGENKRIVLFYFGETQAQVELAVAHLFMAHVHRTEVFLLSCKGDRPNEISYPVPK